MPARLLLLLALLWAAPAQAADLKIATWNLAWLTLRPQGDPMLPRDLRVREEADFQRLAGYARRLAPDIVALQEVDGPEAAARLLDPARYQFFFPDEQDVQRVGFAVLRTLRAAQNPDVAELDIRPRARFSLRRGVDITVQAGGQRLRLLAVHLDGGCTEAPLASDRRCEGLARQAPILAEWIGQRQREGQPFAILGDFNRRLAPREEVWQTLAAAAPLVRATEGFSNPCWSASAGGRPFIDHILLGGQAQGWWRRDSLRVMVYAEREPAFRDRLSDHCPVSIQMSVP